MQLRGNEDHLEMEHIIDYYVSDLTPAEREAILSIDRSDKMYYYRRSETEIEFIEKLFNYAGVTFAR